MARASRPWTALRAATMRKKPMPRPGRDARATADSERAGQIFRCALSPRVTADEIADEDKIRFEAPVVERSSTETQERNAV